MAMLHLVYVQACGYTGSLAKFNNNNNTSKLFTVVYMGNWNLVLAQQLPNNIIHFYPQNSLLYTYVYTYKQRHLK